MKFKNLFTLQIWRKFQIKQGKTFDEHNFCSLLGVFVTKVKVSSFHPLVQVKFMLGILIIDKLKGKTCQDSYNLLQLANLPLFIDPKTFTTTSQGELVKNKSNKTFLKRHN